MDPEPQLREVFASVLACDASALTDHDSPETIDGWDSVNHLNLILAVEAEFGVQFEADDIADLVTFGALRRKVSETIGG